MTDPTSWTAEPDPGWGDSTRCVRAGVGPAVPGTAFLPGPVLAAPYHLSPDEGTEAHTYARASNPGWTGLEAALAELEGGVTGGVAGGVTGGVPVQAAVTGAGMAAITVLLRSVLRAGDVLVVPSDGYYQIRAYAAEKLAHWGIEVREVPTTSTAAHVEGARLVLAETPANPGMDVVDLREVAAAAHATGALLVVDNTTATPLGQQPLRLGADVVVASGTKALSGHSDLLMGYVATTDPQVHAAVLRERALSGSVLGPFEAWLAHRSLASAVVRVDRQCATAAALVQALDGDPRIRGLRWPGLPSDPSHAVASAQMRRYGGVLRFELESAAAVHAFVERSRLVSAATSFGGLHTTADRRARWGDPVSEGFVRISCGIEDTDDVVRDVLAALG